MCRFFVANKLKKKKSLKINLRTKTIKKYIVERLKYTIL